MLDLGVTVDTVNAESNYFEQWYPHKTRIVGAGVEAFRQRFFIDEALRVSCRFFISPRPIAGFPSRCTPR